MRGWKLDNGYFLREYFKLPKRIEKLNSPYEEADFYIKKYRQAKTDKERQQVVDSLRVNGSSWDLISRSCCYLGYFEKKVGKQFPEMWR